MRLIHRGATNDYDLKAFFGARTYGGDLDCGSDFNARRSPVGRGRDGPVPVRRAVVELPMVLQRAIESVKCLRDLDAVSSGK